MIKKTLQILILVTLLFGAYLIKGDDPVSDLALENKTSEETFSKSDFSEEKEVVLPVKWNDLGQQMVEEGVIDAQKFESIYEQNGGISEHTKELLYSSNNENIIINKDNSGEILNLLWAFGLSNNNEILTEGDMITKTDGDPSRLASVGGWTISDGLAMHHYSKHNFLILNEEQQKMVEEISKNIYRPCCNNSTFFPDCNHGMAMLGLIELLVANGLDQDEIYKIALEVNTLWFPQTYMTIAHYIEQKGLSLEDLKPKDILGFDYSSSAGYRNILKQVEPVKLEGGGGCSV